MFITAMKPQMATERMVSGHPFAMSTYGRARASSASALVAGRDAVDAEAAGDGGETTRMYCERQVKYTSGADTNGRRMLRATWLAFRTAAMPERPAMAAT